MMTNTEWLLSLAGNPGLADQDLGNHHVYMTNMNPDDGSGDPLLGSRHTEGIPEEEYIKAYSRLKVHLMIYNAGRIIEGESVILKSQDLFIRDGDKYRRFDNNKKDDNKLIEEIMNPFNNNIGKHIHGFKHSLYSLIYETSFNDVFFKESMILLTLGYENPFQFMVNSYKIRENADYALEKYKKIKKNKEELKNLSEAEILTLKLDIEKYDKHINKFEQAIKKFNKHNKYVNNYSKAGIMARHGAQKFGPNYKMSGQVDINLMKEELNNVLKEWIDCKYYLE